MELDEELREDEEKMDEVEDKAEEGDDPEDEVDVEKQKQSIISRSRRTVKEGNEDERVRRSTRKTMAKRNTG